MQSFQTKDMNMVANAPYPIGCVCDVFIVDGAPTGVLSMRTSDSDFRIYPGRVYGTPGREINLISMTDSLAETVSITYGRGTIFQSSNTTATVTFPNPMPVTGPLTDAELRATPVPVSGIVTTASATQTGSITVSASSASYITLGAMGLTRIRVFGGFIGSAQISESGAPGSNIPLYSTDGFMVSPTGRITGAGSYLIDLASLNGFTLDGTNSVGSITVDIESSNITGSVPLVPYPRTPFNSVFNGAINVGNTTVLNTGPTVAGAFVSLWIFSFNFNSAINIPFIQFQDTGGAQLSPGAFNVIGGYDSAEIQPIWKTANGTQLQVSSSSSIPAFSSSFQFKYAIVYS